MLPPGPPSTATERNLVALLRTEGVELEEAQPGATIALAEGALSIAGVSGEGLVPAVDPRGIAVAITTPSSRFLIPGDVPPTSLAADLDEGAGILIAPPGDLDPAMLDLTNPAAVIVTGEERLESNVFGNRTGVWVWESAEEGMVNFESGDEGLALSTGR